MSLKAFRLSARSFWQVVATAYSSGSGSCCACEFPLGDLAGDGLEGFTVGHEGSPGLLDAGRGGRDVGVGRDGQAVVAERRGDAGVLAALAVVRVRGHGAAEAVRPPGDGLQAGLLAGELQVDLLAVCDTAT